MKVCSKCGVEKPFAEFHKQSRSKDGFQPACKVCMNIAYNASRKKKQEHYQAVAKARQFKNVEWLRQYRSDQKCLLCGESDEVCLDFHHIDPSEKDGDISDMVWSTSIGVVKKEIAKCVVLCSNCHRKTHAGKISIIYCP